MGLPVTIYRDDYDSDMNLFKGKRRLVLVNVEGPFTPDDESPAAELSTNALGHPIVVPLGWGPSKQNAEGLIMFGGSYAATSDSRFKPGFYGAVPIHDRFETWAEYERFSR